MAVSGETPKMFSKFGFLSNSGGSYEANPKRAGEISRDVMKLVSPMFRVIYGISVSYDTSVSGVWNILCEGDMSTLRSELEGYGIRCEGEIRKHANISKIVPELVDDNLKRRFPRSPPCPAFCRQQCHRHRYGHSPWNYPCI